MTPPPLPPKQPPVELATRLPRITTLRGPLLVSIGVVALVVLIAGFILSSARQQAKARKPPEPPPVPTRSSQVLAGIPATYHQALAPKEVDAAPPTPSTPPPIPTPSPGAPPMPPPLAMPSAPAPPVPVRFPPAQAVSQTPAPLQPPKPPSKWLFAETKQTGGVQEPPFPVLKDEQDGPPGQPGSSASRAAGLFPQAVWGTPADPTKVLYRSQVLNGLLQHAINSDQPGLVRILVTEEVQDRFGQGQVLVPQYTILLGAQDGKVAYGQSRLGITIDSMEFPNGTVVTLSQAKGGDDTGATGVAGSVNNHWGKVILGAGITALLSVGTRVPAGNTSGYVATIPQDVASNAGQSISQSGAQIVQRQLNVSPTITIPAATPVTVQLSQNVSFQTPSAIMRK
jgi:type IV secretion system protein TrbI